MSIYDKCLKTINDYYSNTKKYPDTLMMNTEDYLELYKWCMFNWTRNLSEPLTLTTFCDCRIKLKLMGDTECKGDLKAKYDAEYEYAESNL